MQKKKKKKKKHGGEVLRYRKSMKKKNKDGLLQWIVCQSKKEFAFKHFQKQCEGPGILAAAVG